MSDTQKTAQLSEPTSQYANTVPRRNGRTLARCFGSSWMSIHGRMVDQWIPRPAGAPCELARVDMIDSATGTGGLLIRTSSVPLAHPGSSSPEVRESPEPLLGLVETS